MNPIKVILCKKEITHLPLDTSFAVLGTYPVVTHGNHCIFSKRKTTFRYCPTEMSFSIIYNSEIMRNIVTISLSNIY